MINCINCNELINVSENDLTCPICGVLQNITETQVDYFSTHYKQTKKFGKLTEEATPDKKTTKAKREITEVNQKIINELINIRNLLESICKALVNKYNVHHVVEEHVKYLFKLYLNGVINSLSIEDEDNPGSNSNSSVYSDLKRNGNCVAIMILYIGLNKYYYKININSVYKIVYILGVVKNNITKILNMKIIYNFIPSNSNNKEKNKNNNNNNDNSNDEDDNNNNRDSKDYNNRDSKDYNKMIVEKYNNINNNYKLSLRLMCRTIINHFKLPRILYTILDRLIDYYYHYYYGNDFLLDDKKLSEQEESTLCCALVLVLCRLLWPIFHFQPPCFPYLVDKKQNLGSATNLDSSKRPSRMRNLGYNRDNNSSNIYSRDSDQYDYDTNTRRTRSIRKNKNNKWNSVKLVTTPNNHEIKLLELKKYIINSMKESNFNTFLHCIIYKYVKNYFILFKLIPIFNTLNGKSNYTRNNKDNAADNNKGDNNNSDNAASSNNNNKEKEDNNNKENKVENKEKEKDNEENNSSSSIDNLYYSLLDIDFSPLDASSSRNNNKGSSKSSKNNNSSNLTGENNLEQQENINRLDYSNSEIYLKIVNSYNNIDFSGYSFEKSLEFNYFILFTKKSKKNLFKSISNVISFANFDNSGINNIYNPVINKLISSFDNKLKHQYNEQKRRKLADSNNTSSTNSYCNNKENNKNYRDHNTNTSNNKSTTNLPDHESENVKTIFQQFPCVTRLGHTLPPRAHNLRNSSYHGLPVLYLLLLKSFSNFMGVPSYKVHASVVKIESVLIGSVTENPK